MEIPNRTKATVSDAPLIDPKKAKQLISRGKISAGIADKQVCMKISEELLARCDEASSQASITRSAYIKMALLEKLERDGK